MVVAYILAKPRLPAVKIMGWMAPCNEEWQGDETSPYKDNRNSGADAKEVACLPEGSAVKQTLAERRNRFRAAFRDRLAGDGWREGGVAS
jgi:hypothetical protein